MHKWCAIAEQYDPLKCGSIDGTDNDVHDKAVSRAIRARYKPNKGVNGNPKNTLFVGRLSHQTTEFTLNQIFSTFGAIEKVSLIRDVVTGHSRGYAFIEYKDSNNVKHAYNETNKLVIDGNCILVDYELERIMKGWVPRRLGGGFGGKKESGQLRFGCRDRPFKRPIVLRKQEEQPTHERRKYPNYKDDHRNKFSKRSYYKHRS